MSALPIELWRLIASTDVQTYCVLLQVVKGLCEVCPVGASSWEDHFTTVEVDEDGDRRWKLRGKLHRGGDKPARIWPGYYCAWYQHGKSHRGDDKPAVVWEDNGHKEWRQHGKLHRDGDKPAVIHADSAQEWWLDGKRVK